MRKGTIYTLSALVLIAVIFISMPLNFAHKIGSGCLLAQNKCVLKCGVCMCHSVTSQSEADNITLAALMSTPFVFQSSPLLSSERVDSAVTILPHPSSKAPPLRC
jgi:hypothetical protein